MSEGAHLDSIDQLKVFREALVKFTEEARGALSEADSEVRRTRDWLERDQPAHWAGQLKKRKAAAEEAKQRLQHKKLYPDASGGRQSHVEEQKAYRVASARLEEATEKLAHVRRWQKRYEKEHQQYRGQVQALQRVLETEAPKVLAWIDHMLAALEAYVSLSAPEGRQVQAALAVDVDPLPEPMARPPDEDELSPDETPEP